MASGVWRMLSTTGLHRAIHRSLFGQKLTILMYHGIVEDPLVVPDWCFMTTSQFRREMTYLRRHFDVVSLEAGVERLRNDQIRRPTAVITFDDGYQNNFDLAFPILSELRLPATIYLVSDLVDSETTLWFCRLNRALERTEHSHLSWRGDGFDLSSVQARAQTSAALQNVLKSLADDEQRVEVDELIRLLGEDPKSSVSHDSPYRMLDRESIRVMGQSGLIDFGAHTATHAILTRVGPEQRRLEIERSIREVAEMTGKPCTHFAYPNGRAGDYDEEAMAIVQSQGVTTAVTTREGPNSRSTASMELCRYGIGAGTSPAIFECMVHHVFSWLTRSPG